MNILRITRLRLLLIIIIALVIGVMVLNGLVYLWTTSQVPPRQSLSSVGANLSQVVGVEPVALGVFEDGRPYGLLQISNNAAEDMTVTEIYAKALHVYFTVNTSADIDESSNNTMNLEIKPGESIGVKVTLSDHSLGKDIFSIRVDFTIRIKEVQDQLVVMRSFTEGMGPVG